MKHLLHLIVLGLTVSTQSLSLAKEEKPATAYQGKLSTLTIAADALGADWTGPSGLVVNNFQDLSNCPAEFLPLITEIKKLFTPIGVSGCADFTYRKKANSFHQVTLRVFVFDSQKSCEDWCKKKYGYDGWEKHYSLVNDVPYKAVDSTQITKRAIWFGNIWMSCHTLAKTTDHLKVIDLYVDKIKTHSERVKTKDENASKLQSEPVAIAPSENNQTPVFKRSRRAIRRTRNHCTPSTHRRSTSTAGQASSGVRADGILNRNRLRGLIVAFHLVGSNSSGLAILGSAKWK